MAGSINKAILVGHLGADPEIRNTQDGRKIATFSLATSESWRDKNTGERRERTEWHRIVIFGDGRAGIAENYLRKGSKVYLEGQIQTRKWQDQNGNDRYSTEIVLSGYNANLTLIDRKEQSNGSQNRYDAPQQKQQEDQQQGDDSRFDRPLDDEIPF